MEEGTSHQAVAQRLTLMPTYHIDTHWKSTANSLGSNKTTQTVHLLHPIANELKSSSPTASPRRTYKYNTTDAELANSRGITTAETKTPTIMDRKHTRLKIAQGSKSAKSFFTLFREHGSSTRCAPSPHEHTNPIL